MMFFSLLMTFWAQTEEINPAACDLVASGIKHAEFAVAVMFNLHVCYSVTPRAPHVVVFTCVAVEAPLGASPFNPLNETCGCHHLKVAVDGAETYMRKHLSHLVMEFVSGGVRCALGQCFKYKAALPGHTDEAILINNSMHY
jgi:hypothetical protein